MAHSCELCGDACYCDGEDTFLSQPTDCTHICEEDEEDCSICEGHGCGSCIPDEQCCAAFPDCLHAHPNRGNRKAISEALVAPLFDTTKK